MIASLGFDSAGSQGVIDAVGTPGILAALGILVALGILGLLVGWAAGLFAERWTADFRANAVFERDAGESDDVRREGGGSAGGALALLSGRRAGAGAPRWLTGRMVAISLAMAVLSVGLGWRFAAQPWVLPTTLYVAAVGLALVAIDLETRMLPNLLTLPSYPLVALVAIGGSALGHGWPALGRALVGAAVAVLLYGVVFIAGGVGMGDVKLAGVLGLALGWLGWNELVVGLVLGVVYGGLAGVALVALRRAGRGTELSFGPYLVAGAISAFFIAGPVTEAYLGLWF